jgi:hypothetical protein
VKKGEIEKYKEQEKECEDKLKRNEEHLKKLESEKKREHHEGEFGVVLGCSVSTSRLS